MTWTKLAGTCDEDDCPTVYRTEHGTIAVQGMVTKRPGDVRLSPGEAVVEVPMDLLMEAARAAR